MMGNLTHTSRLEEISSTFVLNSSSGGMSRNTNTNCCITECGKKFTTANTCSHASIDVCSQANQMFVCRPCLMCSLTLFYQGITLDYAVMYIFVILLSSAFALGMIYIFWRYLRISKAKKASMRYSVLAEWQSGDAAPNAPALPAGEASFSNLQAVVCHVQDSTEPLPNECRFCEVQKLAGAPICSRCGNSLFLVAKEIVVFQERPAGRQESNVDVSTSHRFFPP
ncbi:hypothetical protein GUITHDRAFT_140489 [Guillardia theta CCMP2712]|uniref:Uncharacterized protein n=1 Tax=Guillardia theta (strain CCMP2712) TaxID=905079 RepID=L1J5T5_GUITC|nr:hypothetical protein GUITHDRAFT_140489 [Guillardia theta CCMP2712]EKX43445.1 hypothetical protein GUITHDRAFT_140489 [Guillardia theta CCMP2712]|eukprot:XP_005830425.1 hypothetical protein GUITHDRAFT_140489 [Guillardia theta CCMP2712]